MPTYEYAQLREDIFPDDIFRGPNRLFDSVSDAESHDIKTDVSHDILDGFLGGS